MLLCVHPSQHHTPRVLRMDAESQLQSQSQSMMSSPSVLSISPSSNYGAVSLTVAGRNGSRAARPVSRSLSRADSAFDVPLHNADCQQAWSDAPHVSVTNPAREREHESAFFPLHFWSACSAASRTMCQFSKSITSKDINRGMSDSCARGWSVEALKR